MELNILNRVFRYFYPSDRKWASKWKKPHHQLLEINWIFNSKIKRNESQPKKWRQLQMSLQLSRKTSMHAHHPKHQFTNQIASFIQSNRFFENKFPSRSKLSYFRFINRFKVNSCMKSFMEHFAGWGLVLWFTSNFKHFRSHPDFKR